MDLPYEFIGVATIGPKPIFHRETKEKLPYDRFPKTLGIHRIHEPYVFIGMKQLCNPMNSYLFEDSDHNLYDRFPKTLGIHRVLGPYIFIGMKKLCNPMSS